MSFLSLNLGLNIAGFVFSDKIVSIYEGPKEVLTGMPFFEAAILNCHVVEDAQLMDHPIENGSMITDHKVDNPTEIDIQLCMPSFFYASIYKELKNLYDNGTKLSIKTKMSWYHNMVLQAMPHEEKPETVDRIIFNLHFKEVIIVQPVYIKMPVSGLKNPENSTTQKLGENVSNNQLSENKSLIIKGVNSLKGLF